MPAESHVNVDTPAAETPAPLVRTCLTCHQGGALECSCSTAPAAPVTLAMNEFRLEGVVGPVQQSWHENELGIWSVPEEQRMQVWTCQGISFQVTEGPLCIGVVGHKLDTVLVASPWCQVDDQKYDCCLRTLRAVQELATLIISSVLLLLLL